MTKQPLTNLQVRRYLDSHGDSCPFCRSQEIHSGPLDADGSRAYADCKCHKCGRYWTDEWRLTGIDTADEEM